MSVSGILKPLTIINHLPPMILFQTHYPNNRSIRFCSNCLFNYSNSLENRRKISHTTIMRGYNFELEKKWIFIPSNEKYTSKENMPCLKIWRRQLQV